LRFVSGELSTGTFVAPTSAVNFNFVYDLKPLFLNPRLLVLCRSGRYSETTTKTYNQWPANPEGFREACEEYTAAVVHLGNLLLGLITVTLGLPFNYFHHCFDKENTIRARLNYYPQCPLASMVCGVNRYDPVLDSPNLLLLIS